MLVGLADVALPQYQAYLRINDEVVTESDDLVEWQPQRHLHEIKTNVGGDAIEQVVLEDI